MGLSSKDYFIKPLGELLKDKPNDHFAFQQRFLSFRATKNELEMNQRKISKNNNTPKNPLVFKFIAILIPFIILIVLEGILRLANYGDDLHLFIQNPEKGYEKFMMVNPKIGKKYFQKFEYSLPPNDIFYAKKPANTFRIFVMGSSTVIGFPYERNLMFSRILNKQLADAYPDKKIEVVNTAITAINSFTLLDYTNEILKYQPDAILIYAGHNEFYGAFGIGSNETMSRNRGLTRTHIFLMKFRLYQMVRNIISGVAGKFSTGGKAVHGTLMKRIVANADILMNSDEYRIAMKRYRENMGDILKKFHQKNVPVFFSDLISNVKDIAPFNSIANDSLPAAIDIFNEAKAAVENGDFNNARRLFYRAKDLDCIRFRASEDVNRIVDELAEKYGAIKVPMLKWFKENSKNQLIGNNVMTEHVHPNIKGIFLMAQEFCQKVVESEVIGKETSPGYSMEYYRRNWGYTELDSLLAHHRIQQLKGYWPFVKDISNERDYREYYRPVSYVDSLAFEVMRNPELNLAVVRLNMARNYEKNKQFEKAYKEYDALLCTNPYLAINYRDAANCLIQLGDLPLALKYYRASLEYETSFVALFRIGEINLIKGDYEDAIADFKKSFDLCSR